jgi:hypothetical protein
MLYANCGYKSQEKSWLFNALDLILEWVAKVEENNV